MINKISKFFVRWILPAFGIMIMATAVFAVIMLRDRNPRYVLDIQIEQLEPSSIEAGFYALPITPEIPDYWRDVDGDGQFNIEQGDYYEDRNGNDQFDPIYMAGFQNNRPAAGIHDDLWARGMVIQVDSFTLGMVVLDVIGFMHSDVIKIREQIAREVNIDYTIVISTHTHEAPDVLGLWGPTHFKSGVDKDYRQMVIDRGATTIIQSYKDREPVSIRVAQDLTSANHLVEDSREPYILDIGVRMIQFISKESGNTLGSICAWANHPETLWDKNLLITSDFPHYVRDYIERGIIYGDSVYTDGIGGVNLYLNGAIGGLMTTSPRFGIEHPITDSFYMEPSFEKADAQGMAIAKIGLDALANEGIEFDQADFKIHAKTLHLPIDNKNFRLAALLGIIDKGLSGWIATRSELCIWQMGPISFLHQPGEIYPEIVNGGVENPPGADYQMEPFEKIPLRDMMKGPFKFVIGLSSDMVGYIIPKSEWDSKPPFLYNSEESPYGEINSLGPETSIRIYEELSNMFEEF